MMLQLIVAITGLVSAAAALVHAIRVDHKHAQRSDSQDERIDALTQAVLERITLNEIGKRGSYHDS